MIGTDGERAFLVGSRYGKTVFCIGPDGKVLRTLVESYSPRATGNGSGDFLLWDGGPRFTRYDNTGNKLRVGDVTASNKVFAIDAVSLDGLGNVLADTIPSASQFPFNRVLVKMNKNGQVEWEQELDLNRGRFAADARGNVYVTGSTKHAAVLTKYSPEGKRLWKKQIMILSPLSFLFWPR